MTIPGYLPKWSNGAFGKTHTNRKKLLQTERHLLEWQPRPSLVLMPGVRSLPACWAATHPMRIFLRTLFCCFLRVAALKTFSSCFGDL